MCGIGGVLRVADRRAAAPTRSALARMAAVLHHRGPDERGILQYAHDLGLCHTRLSIIDLANGRQPLTIDDGRFAIVYNGELYNHVELRAELEREGHWFATQSDTEVVLRAWRCWGPAALPRFNGQWAFAIYDRNEGVLDLCRDRVGIRPLYYAVHEGQLLFASEVKGLFAAAPDFPRRFDPEGFDEILTFWSAVAPRTAFQGVYQVPPGCFRRYRRGAGLIEEIRYHQPDLTPRFRGSDDDAVAAIAQRLEEATRLRMLRADVPVGCYLSGGLDSSLVAALASRALGGDRFHTFSLRFVDQEYDETTFQRAMTTQLGSRHHDIVVERDHIANRLPEVIRHAETPILRTAPAPLLMLSELVRDHGIKVVLTGEGADEMFAGYDIFREGAVRRFWARAPLSTCRPRLLERLYPYLARSPVTQQAMARRFFGRDLHRHQEPGFAHALRWQTTAALKRMLRPEMRGKGDVEAALLGAMPDAAQNWSHLGRDQYLEIQTLLSGYLLSSQGDRMLMGSSVEGRFPFLDPEVMGLACSLFDRHKLRALDEKWVLKRMGAALLPPEIVSRKKQPYRAPDAVAFAQGTPPPWVDEVLAADAIDAAGVFLPQAATMVWRKCRARAESGQFSNTDNMAVIALLTTQLLHREVVNAPLPEPVTNWTVDVELS